VSQRSIHPEARSRSHNACPAGGDAGGDRPTLAGTHVPVRRRRRRRGREKPTPGWTHVPVRRRRRRRGREKPTPAWTHVPVRRRRRRRGREKPTPAWTHVPVRRRGGLYALPPDAPILNAVARGAGVTREARKRLTGESIFQAALHLNSEATHRPAHSSGKGVRSSENRMATLPGSKAAFATALKNYIGARFRHTR